MPKAFASQGDMEDTKISFTQIGDRLYAFTAEGDPNTGVIIGDESVILAIDADAPDTVAEDGVTARRVALLAGDDPTGT